jgi:MFS family permease
MATRLGDDLKEQSWGAIIKTLGDELRSFIQQEMQLVKVELGAKVKQAGIGAGMFGAAGFMGFLAAGALTAALILGLALVVPGWAAALIVAGFYGLVAAVLALSGRKKVQSATPLAPEAAIRTAQATKDRMQQAWERGATASAPAGNGWAGGLPAPGVTESAPAGTPQTREEPSVEPYRRATPFRSHPPRY